MDEIPAYIERRLRTSAPDNACVVRGSTPVLAFGALSKASVATLGLNPSKVEFIDRDGQELKGNARRLSTLTSLGVNDLTNAAGNALKQVVTDCEMYFSRNPYRRWFDQLEYILNGCGTSYYDGSACHLDLVQWATDPTWSGLDRSIRSVLLKQDALFLEEQLRCEGLKVLLVNGSAVVRQLQKQFDLSLVDEPSIIIDGDVKSKIWSTNTFNRVHVIGWSTNLQSSFGVSTEFRKLLRNRVGTMVQNYK